MCKNHSAILALLTLILAGCSSRAAEPRNEIPDDLQAILEQAGQFELLSLSPILPKDEIPKDAFHEWEMLGKTTVKNAETRKKLIAAFKKGVEENEGIAASCFTPRHGIRVIHGGKTADFVICFECLQVHAYVGDQREKGFLITASPQAVFDSVLKEAKVPLAEKPKK